MDVVWCVVEGIESEARILYSNLGIQCVADVANVMRQLKTRELKTETIKNLN